MEVVHADDSRHEHLGCGRTRADLRDRPGRLRSDQGDKKRTEAGLIHWPHRVDASWHVDREAGPSDRPQKIEKSCLGSELLHHVRTMAYSGSWPLIDYFVPSSNGSIEAASPCGWPNNFSCHLPVFAADLVDNENSPASQLVFQTTAS